MAEKNKTTVIINSRQYVVVSEESSDYINGLAEHINEKIKAVLESGSNVAGERPLVLAALNICDEYFKTFEARLDLQDEIDRLNKTFEDIKRSSKEVDQLQQEVVSYSKELSKSAATIKNLEAHVKRLEGKRAEQEKQDNDLREEEENLRKSAAKEIEELKKAHKNEISQLKKEQEQKLSELRAEFERREAEFLEMIDRS